MATTTCWVGFSLANHRPCHVHPSLVTDVRTGCRGVVAMGQRSVRGFLVENAWARIVRSGGSLPVILRSSTTFGRSLICPNARFLHEKGARIKKKCPKTTASSRSSSLEADRLSLDRPVNLITREAKLPEAFKKKALKSPSSIRTPRPS